MLKYDAEYYSISNHRRPPNLLAPGVLHFRTDQSKKYYFHPKVSRLITNTLDIICRYLDKGKIWKCCIPFKRPLKIFPFTF